MNSGQTGVLTFDPSYLGKVCGYRYKKVGRFGGESTYKFSFASFCFLSEIRKVFITIWGRKGDYLSQEEIGEQLVSSEAEW